ncbi:UDP-N-acetylglucosamine transporter-like protein [Fimicolochytrium jonesii]|uniref:UDP-N-acetylglucosamine transporter-like protein n=1 Tax=Fimicolochytrium jonesii TaxID=1396493 RepID=UPI0022FF116E|nr:UDP-N-acetylglucosamine transporter-like protein [Fimicolochytrium jonesii]KAI8824925.1 UDP-N-acetylglucosamine transporter-like protein [Fimicolochytrium jonesii]
MRAYSPILSRGGGVNATRLKYGALLALAAQNTISVMVLRWARKSATERNAVASTAVFLSEVIKALVCAAIYIWQDGRTGAPVASSGRKLYLDAFGQKSSWAKMAIPAGLYTIQNWLHYFALARLDATTHQVTLQLRILTTAVFSVIMLRKRLSLAQWVSLGVLTAGLAMTQLPHLGSSTSATLAAAGTTAGTTAANAAKAFERLIGLAAVGMICVSSGFSGVYLERMLKDTPTSLLVRNVQLSCFGSLFCGVFGILLNDRATIVENGFFAGYGWATTCAVLLSAVGGLLVATVIKYADNIVKNSAIALSIIASGALSSIIGDFQLTPPFLLGGLLVVASVWTYSSTPIEKVHVGGSQVDMDAGGEEEEMEKGVREPFVGGQVGGTLERIVTKSGQD